LTGVEFKDGVSVDPISPSIAARIAGTMRCEMTDSGLNPSHTQSMVDRLNDAAPVVEPMERQTEEQSTLEGQTLVTAEQDATKHSKESLEAIADSSGIKGLREIADPLGIKAQSIADLIEKILATQQ
jgi:hypothetical protein